MSAKDGERKTGSERLEFILIRRRSYVTKSSVERSFASYLVATISNSPGNQIMLTSDSGPGGYKQFKQLYTRFM